MKRKIIFVNIILLILMMLFSGCGIKRDRDNIIDLLEKENYIKSDWKLIDKMNETDLLYIYEDNNSTKYKVCIPKEHHHNQYIVCIYSNVKLDENTNKYDNGTVQKNVGIEFEKNMLSSKWEIIPEESGFLK